MNERSSHRAGRLTTQLGNYKAFIPAPLPPDPPLVLDAEMWRLLSDADRALGRLDGVTQILPNQNLFLLMYIKKEALLSSQIEGTQASLDDVIRYEENMAAAENRDDVEEVLNYVRAINLGRDLLQSLPVSLRLIRSLHKTLMQGVRGQSKNPGEFRTSQNWIGPAGCTLDEATFVPPPPHTLTEHLGGWEVFVQSEHQLPMLAIVGFAHAQFETIHPFLDGNGRMGRLLITLLLCEKRILRWPSLYLSAFFKEHRAEYYERLQATRDYGDWEGWTKFFLRGVRTVAKEATETATAIVDLREADRMLLSDTLEGSAVANAHALVDLLFQRPFTNVSRAAEELNISYASANTLIGKLRQLNILEETTGYKRNREFRYTRYLHLLSV